MKNQLAQMVLAPAFFQAAKPKPPIKMEVKLLPPAARDKHSLPPQNKMNRIRKIHSLNFKTRSLMSASEISTALPTLN